MRSVLPERPRPLSRTDPFFVVAVRGFCGVICDGCARLIWSLEQSRLESKLSSRVNHRIWSLRITAMFSKGRLMDTPPDVLCYSWFPLLPLGVALQTLYTKVQYVD